MLTYDIIKLYLSTAKANRVQARKAFRFSFKLVVGFSTDRAFGHLKIVHL